MRSGEAEMKMNFSDLNVWSYSCDAYIIPVWGEHGLSGGEDCRMVYALIRDDPLEMLARDVEEEQDSLFDTQVQESVCSAFFNRNLLIRPHLRRSAWWCRIPGGLPQTGGTWWTASRC